MSNWNFVFAGFGGQGILFTGKVVAYTGMLEGQEVSWLPSYGPEMRGGTANCSVCLSDQPVASPLVLEPNALVVMNTPSYEKFIGTVAPGGFAVMDSTLIGARSDRGDITCGYLPATRLAQERELQGLANIIMLGGLLKLTRFTTLEALEEGMKKSVPASKQHLVEPNLRAIRLGMELVEV